jgi:hypothetical protein
MGCAGAGDFRDVDETDGEPGRDEHYVDRGKGGHGEREPLAGGNQRGEYHEKRRCDRPHAVCVPFRFPVDGANVRDGRMCTGVARSLPAESPRVGGVVTGELGKTLWFLVCG